MTVRGVDLHVLAGECSQLRDVGLEVFIDSPGLGIRIPDGESLDHFAYGGDPVLHRNLRPSHFRSVVKQLVRAAERYPQWAELNGHDAPSPTDAEIIARNIEFWGPGNFITHRPAGTDFGGTE